MHRLRHLLTLLLLLAPLPALGQQLTLIPDLHSAWGVSENGVVVGRAQTGLAARWEAGSTQTLTAGGLAFEGWALDVSTDGSVVVGQSLEIGPGGAIDSIAFRWTAASGAIPLSAGADDAALATSGNGLRAAGLVENALFTPGIGGVLWLNSTTPTYVHPEANSATAISQNGRRAAGSGDRTASSGLYGEAYRTNVGDGAVEWLGFVGTPHDIDNRSRIVGSTGAYPAIGEAFVWTPAGGLTLLGDLPGGVTASEARGIGANGQVVVGFGMGPNGAEAVIWTPTRGLQRLADDLVTVYGYTLPPGVTLIDVAALTLDAKTLVGSAIDAAGTRVAYLLELP